MPKQIHYLIDIDAVDDPVLAVLQGVDRDVARGEDILMLGFGIVMLSSTFAPIAPPTVILPFVALTFAISASCARHNYFCIEQKLLASMPLLELRQRRALHPISTVFAEHPMPSLADSFNLFKNLKRTWKSVLGGILINPFWMPIFYVMGMQIDEEKNLICLNKAVIQLENQLL